jgi:murein biosynthesis integral membrane protein MurJ
MFSGPALLMLSFRAPIAAVATVLVALGVLVVPAAAVAETAPASTATSAPTATSTPSATVAVSPASQGVLKPGDDLQLSVTVTNRTDAALPASTASLSIIRSVVGTREDLSDWIDDTSSDGYTGVDIASIPVPEVTAHHSTTVGSITVPAATVGLQYYTSFGARRIAVDYDAGSVHAVGRSTITWYPSSTTTAPTDVAVAMPITVPATSDELLSAATLAADTAVDGTLTQQLDAAEGDAASGHNVAIGIDPRIIASIRILGVNAPDSATAWLERLETTRNETFALSWADADVTGLRQAGANGILAPISLDGEIAAAKTNFPGATTPTPTPTPTATAGSGSTATATATPTPTATATGKAGTQGQQPGDQATAPATLPTTQGLLDFPYTLSGIAWPTEDSVATDDLPALTAAGSTHTIVSNGNTTSGSETTVGAAEKIGNDSVIVSDEQMSKLLRTAASASDEAEWQAAMTDLTAMLATTTRTGDIASPLLLTLGREWPTDASRLSQTLDGLESIDWASPTDLSTAVAATPGTVALSSRTESDARLAELTKVVDAENGLTDFSTALTTPTDLTEGARLRTLTLASNGWRADEAGFATAVAAQAKRAARTTQSVAIVDSSNINLFADRSSLPISVRNKSAYPVKVYLTVTPSNSFLRVSKNRLPVTVQPDSQSRITFPVQSVANGKVELKMALTSATNVPISTPSTVEINVQAQWESIITAVAAAAVVLIFGLGILRNVRRRLRRRRDGEPDEDDEIDPNTPLDEIPEPVESAALVDAPAFTAAATTTTTTTTATAPTTDGDPLAGAIARAQAAPDLQTAQGGEEDVPYGTTAAQPAIDAGPTAERGLGRASALLAAGTMVSRVLGFVKTFVLAAAIGQSGSDAANAFAVSNQLPNSVYTLIAGGLLSAALIPQIVRATKHPDGGQKYIDKIVTIGVSVFLAVTVIATIGAPILVGIYSQQSAGGGKGFSDSTTALAVAFAFWCLPQILFYALYSLLGEVLNARQVFGPFTWAPLLNNVIAIGGLVVFIALFGTRAENSDPLDWTPTKIAVLAGTATLGVAVQAGFLVLFWRRAGLTYRPDFRWRGVGLRTTGTAAGWLFLMILVTQLAGVVQSRVTSLGTGAANATLQNAWLLFMLPHSIITVSIATAYFTRMSHDAERGDLGAVRRNLSLSLRIVGLFTVFASVALMVVAFPFARLYEHAFGDVTAMAEVLLAYMPGLVLFSMLFIIQRAFWAMHDHRTPFLMQLVQSILFVIGALAVQALPGSLIGIGVAGVTTLAGCTQTIVALVIVRRRLGGIEGPNVTRSHVQFVIAAIIAGVAGLVVANFFGAFQASGFAMTDITSAGITVVLTAGVMTVVYFTALVVAKNGEIRSAVDLLRARLRR